MDDTARAQEMWTQFAGKNLEMLTVWAEANQRIMSDWVDFTSGAAKEGLRLYGELQVKALEGMTAVIVNLNRRYKGHAGVRIVGLP